MDKSTWEQVHPEASVDMDKSMPQQVHLKTSVSVDKSVIQAGAPVKGLWLMDKSMLEQG